MTDPNHLQNLIKLLDGDSQEVNQLIIDQLLKYGEDLIPEIKKLIGHVTEDQLVQLNIALERHKQNILKKKWNKLFEIKDEGEKLEEMLKALAQYQSGIEYEEDISTLLDQLANEFTRQEEAYGTVKSPYKLAKFLFRTKEFRGTRKDYYNPNNSNLAYVLREKKGLPITLSCVYILVAKRLGFEVEGCHIPGHFMTRIEYEGRQVLVDCFNGGSVLEEKDILNLTTASRDTIQKMLEIQSTTDLIIRRVLNNLIHAYHLKEDNERSVFMADLVAVLNNQIDLADDEFGSFDESQFSREPLFKIGQKVKHKRYGYRGLIVDFDTECYANDEWYKANQTQPRRNQAWYHVLVHDTVETTYAAESSLLSDDSSDAINHAFVSYYFDITEDGQYKRNNKPWDDVNL